jgi:hypothetical protein
MLTVHQHWDPLKVCVVGRSYPPEFYSWITVPHVRKLFEKIAIETEEDYQNIINKLHSFGVETIRPNLSTLNFFNNQFMPPPMNPRDVTAMIGDTFYTTINVDQPFQTFYNSVKDPSWPDCYTLNDFKNLPMYIQQECTEIHGLDHNVLGTNEYQPVFDFVKQQGNKIKYTGEYDINGAMVSRIGRDLYFGTRSYYESKETISHYQEFIDQEFNIYRNHIVNTGGHSDGTFCAVCPGLIVSLYDIPTYQDTFPGWEVVYLPGQSWHKVDDFLKLKQKNQGRWWIPGFEHDHDVINVVEQWLGHWTGYVEETVFDVNMLVVDPKNVLVFNYNKTVFDALERHGVTPHIVPFRHRYFWDGGIHCITSDLHREGHQQDYFPHRG